MIRIDHFWKPKTRLSGHNIDLRPLQNTIWTYEQERLCHSLCHSLCNLLMRTTLLEWCTNVNYTNLVKFFSGVCQLLEYEKALYHNLNDIADVVLITNNQRDVRKLTSDIKPSSQWYNIRDAKMKDILKLKLRPSEKCERTIKCQQRCITCTLRFIW